MSSSGSDGSAGYMHDSYAAYFSAAQQYYVELAEKRDLLDDYSPTDYGIAMFLMVVTSVLLVAFALALAVFFLKRNEFEIRARSPSLVMLCGACMMVVLPLNIIGHTKIIFDAEEPDLVLIICLYYFTIVCATSCFCSRMVRLAVMYNARARTAVPWLTSERGHIGVCLLLGVSALGFPLYDRYDIGDRPFADLLFYDRSAETLWRVTVASQAVAFVLWAINWKTDDIFNIAGELRIATFGQLFATLAGRLGETHLSAPANHWIDQETMGLLSAIIVFCGSIGMPILSLLRHPLKSSDPKVAQILAKRKQGGRALAIRVSEASTATAGDFAADRADATNVLWTYEKVTMIPEISVAFDDFARKALCQESARFLKAVGSYESKWKVSANDSGEGNNSDKYSAFTKIVQNYIMDGAPDEVNLSFEDKSAILKIHQVGRSGFDGLDDKKRRFVFASAYAELRYILEANLMERFVSSDGFKAAARLTTTAE